MVVEIHPWKNYKSAIKRMKRLGRPLPVYWDAIKTKHGRQGGPERFVQEIMEALVHSGGPLEVQQSEQTSEDKSEDKSEDRSEQQSEQQESGEQSELRTERGGGFYRHKYFGNTGWGREVHSYERRLK